MQTNLRYHNRVTTRLEAIMSTGKNQALIGTLANISKAGLMIECSRQVVEDLIPRDSTPSPKTPVRLEVAFDLWLSEGQPEHLHSICNIIHVRRKSREIYQVGVEFLSFPHNDYAAVVKYVDQRLQAS
ncbi:MAG: PilZ domain-containing protein [Hahellaceae bacterium]|jgi:hypothetical protein|nr:PilZ domain-containing protein [Hahellaceae bacterium]MCP5211198.1 PilZ domain-containing protein [Hahellaceae bacterium]